MSRPLEEECVSAALAVLTPPPVWLSGRSTIPVGKLISGFSMGFLR